MPSLKEIAEYVASEEVEREQLKKYNDHISTLFPKISDEQRKDAVTLLTLLSMRMEYHERDEFFSYLKTCFENQELQKIGGKKVNFLITEHGLVDRQVLRKYGITFSEPTQIIETDVLEPIKDEEDEIELY